MKICSNPKCQHKGKPQPLSNFHRKKKSPDGLQGYCKDCSKIAVKNFEKTPKGKLNKKKRYKKFMEKNPDYWKNLYKNSPKRRRSVKENNDKNNKKATERYRNDLEYREKIKKDQRERYHKNKGKK